MAIPKRLPDPIESRLDRFLLRAALEPRPWWRAIGHWMLVLLARLTLYFGRTFPYIYRPWAWLSAIMTHRLDRNHYATARSMFLRRMFSLRRPAEAGFKPQYALLNWATIAAIVWFGVIGFVLDGMYAYGTYFFGTVLFGPYKDVVVTQAYPYREVSGGMSASQSTFAIHGYQEKPNGEKIELYFELGPNLWFGNWYPEFMFGQVPHLGRCTFWTYGMTLRFLRGARRFYVLNPWVVDMKCTAPNIVPPEKD